MSTKLTQTQILASFLDQPVFPNPINHPKFYSTFLGEETRQSEDEAQIDTSFFIQGSYQSGKTHYAILFLRDWILNKFPNGFENTKHHDMPVFVQMPFLERLVKKINFTSYGDYDSKKILEKFKVSDLLIIDDLTLDDLYSSSKKQVKTDMVTTLFDIFDYRYANNLQTVLTTNIDLDTISDTVPYFNEITSKLFDLQVKLTKTDLVEEHIKPKTLEIL